MNLPETPKSAKSLSAEIRKSERRCRVSWDCASGFGANLSDFADRRLKQHDVNIVMVLRQLAGAESLERSTLHTACIVIFASLPPNLTSTELNTHQHSQSHWSSVKLPSRMSSGSVLHPSYGARGVTQVWL